MKLRVPALLMAALMGALVAWMPLSMKTASAIYCYPGDPPDVYQACLAYNAGIAAQVANQQQLLSIQNQIGNAEAQINALSVLITNLEAQMAAQRTMIAQTQARIDDLNRQIRFKEADLTRLRAHVTVREELLNQRLRYIDSHGAVNYIQLVLTASSFNDLMNRMIAAQQVAASDQRLVSDLNQEHFQVTQEDAQLGIQLSQVAALLEQQKATEAALEQTRATDQAAIAQETKLEAQLQVQYQQLEQQRAAIDAQVAQLAQEYDAAAAKAGGGSGVFEWPMPACGHGCISQPFGCSTFWAEPYWASCPYPHKIHTGIDIAGPYGTPIVAADTGIIYFYSSPYGYGNYVVIIHGNGYSTLYGHLSAFASGLSDGQIVARGDLIAYEGSTGNSTGPHLHFEVRTYNVWKDPCIWLGC